MEWWETLKPPGHFQDTHRQEAVPCRLLPGELSWPVTSGDIHRLMAFCTLCPSKEHPSIFVERVPPRIPELEVIRKLRARGPRTSPWKKREVSPPNATVGTDCSRKPGEVSVGGRQQRVPGSAPAPSQAPLALRAGVGGLFPPAIIYSSQALVRGSSRDSPVTTGPRVSARGGPADPRQTHMPTKQRFLGTSLSLC